MRARNKSFLEDTFILFVIGVIIYVIYSFLFSSNEKIDIEENKTMIEKKVEADTNEEPISIEKDKVIPEEIEKSVMESQKEDSIEIENINKDTNISVDTTIVEKNTDEKENLKPIIDNKSNEKTSTEFFYKDIEEKIYENIEKNVDKSMIKNGEFINIRVTILKDGKYEQLTFMDGNKEYFNLIRSSIVQAFPVKIDETLKEDFPRYFRMKIEIK